MGVAVPLVLTRPQLRQMSAQFWSVVSKGISAAPGLMLAFMSSQSVPPSCTAS